MRAVIPLVLIPAFLVCVAAGAWAAEYRAVDLGPIASFAYDFEINNAGRIVGPVGGIGHAYIWTADGGVTDLGPIFGSADSSTYAINDAGQIALYVNGRVYLWSEGTGPVYLGALPQAGKSCPRSINALGEVAGWAYAPNEEHGVVWKADGTIVDLGPGSASDINDQGRVVGLSGGSYPRDGVIWNPDGSVTHIGLLVSPQGINSAGHVVGYRWQNDRRRGFYWTQATGLRNLPLLPGAIDGYLISYAHDINDAGQIVGYSLDVLGRYRAVVWNSDLTITELQPLTGYEYSEAYGINDLGWVVGYSSDAVNGSGDYHLTLWKPVPEPSCLSTLALLLATAVGVGLGRRHMC